jgi:hypothetical protein
MAIVMVSLNPTKTGEFVARKVIPKDARGTVVLAANYARDQLPEHAAGEAIRVAD